MNKNINIGHSYNIIIFSFIYGLSFYYLKMFSKQNSWLIVLIGNFLGFLFIKMILVIKNSYKDKTIYEINKIILGNFLGTITNIIFTSVFILLSAIISWYLFIFLKTSFLEKTPIIIIAIISLLPIFYAANKNSIVLIKSNVIFSFIILILTIIAIIFLSPQAELSNLKPFLEVKPNNMIYALFGFTCTAFLPTYAINSQNKLIFKNIINQALKTLLLTLSIVFSTYLILGNSIAEMVDFPEFFVLRKIGLLANGTRIDSLIIIGFLLSIYASNLTFIFFVRDYLTIEIKSYKNSYTYLIIIIIFFLSLNLFKNVTIGKIFILNVHLYILFFSIFFLNLIIYLKLKMKPQEVSHK